MRGVQARTAAEAAITDGLFDRGHELGAGNGGRTGCQAAHVAAAVDRSHGCIRATPGHGTGVQAVGRLSAVACGIGFLS